MRIELARVELVNTEIAEVRSVNGQPLKQPAVFLESFLLFFFVFSFVCVAAVTLAKEISNKVSHKDVEARFPTMPCPKCRFFNNNPHLRCAVHPTTTMTERASSCVDYTPRQVKQRS